MSAHDRSEHDARSSSVVSRSLHAQLASDALFQLSPDAILAIDSEGVIRAANERTRRIFAYDPDELIGCPVDILIPERLRQQHVAHRARYAASPSTRRMGAAMNLFALRKDGLEVAVDVMLRPLDTPEGMVTLYFARDISERNDAMEILRAHDQQLRSIIDCVHDYAIYLLDRGGHVMTWNPGAERIEGYSEGEVLFQHFSVFFLQEDVEAGKPAELMRLAAERGRIEDQGWQIRKDGSRFWSNSILTVIRDSTGAVTGYAKITRDVTDRKRAEEAIMLQLSTALLANMDVRALLLAISASIGEVIPHDSATLALYDADSGMLLANFLTADEKGVHRDEVRIPVEGSPVGAAFRTREPVIVERFEESPFASGTIAHLTSIGMRSGCFVPLLYRGEPVGTMTIASRAEAAFNEHDAAMLIEIAGQVAMAVNNARTFQRMQELRDRLSQEKRYLEEEIALEGHFDDIVGESTGLRRVLREVETVAPTDATVLIEGETGTGKELLARAIHRLSPRKDRTFVKINCAAIPTGLIESELFGHEKGAFTGALARKIGRLELAHEGTLFLDEVGELPLELQPKLLRALQEREIERVGGNHAIPVNVRLIAATNRDLGKMVAEKQFRSDLYYRLKVFPLFAPPLRDRTGDIPILVRHFVESHSRRMGKRIESIPEDTMDALTHWKWPGNVRELENFLERAVILTRGSVLFVPLAELEITNQEVEAEAGDLSDPTLHTAEREHILRVLRETGGQVGGPEGAAARLGLKRTTLNSKMKKLAIDRSDYMPSS